MFDADGSGTIDAKELKVWYCNSIHVHVKKFSHFSHHVKIYQKLSMVCYFVHVLAILEENSGAIAQWTI